MNMGMFSPKTAQGAFLLQVDHHAVPRLLFVGGEQPGNAGRTEQCFENPHDNCHSAAQRPKLSGAVHHVHCNGG
jgi:hypothetical protein